VNIEDPIPEDVAGTEQKKEEEEEEREAPPVFMPMYGPSRARAICVVNRNGKIYYRAYREDAEKPSPYQIQARIALGEVGKTATGTKMTEGLPPAAVLVREKLTGAYFGQTYHPRKWETLLSSYYSSSSSSD
jgi:hypothetical protein